MVDGGLQGTNKAADGPSFQDFVLIFQFWDFFRFFLGWHKIFFLFFLGPFLFWLRKA